MRRRWWVLGLLILLICVATPFLYQNYQERVASRLASQKAGEARKNLEIGMDRARAEKALTDAVAHYHCAPYFDHYLFNENVYISAPISIRFVLSGTEEIISDIYGSEGYFVAVDLPTCKRIR